MNKINFQVRAAFFGPKVSARDLLAYRLRRRARYDATARARPGCRRRGDGAGEEVRVVQKVKEGIVQRVLEHRVHVNRCGRDAWRGDDTGWGAIAVGMTLAIAMAVAVAVAEGWRLRHRRAQDFRAKIYHDVINAVLGLPLLDALPQGLLAPARACRGACDTVCKLRKEAVGGSLSFFRFRSRLVEAHRLRRRNRLLLMAATGTRAMMASQRALLLAAGGRRTLATTASGTGTYRRA